MRFLPCKSFLTSMFINPLSFNKSQISDEKLGCISKNKYPDIERFDFA